MKSNKKKVAGKGRALVERQHEHLMKLKKISWRNGFYFQKYFLIDGLHKLSKWRWYDNQQNEPIDYRSVLLNEIIFEIDVKEWKLCKRLAMKIIDVLNAYQTPFYICPSGGKGIHVHVFFNCDEYDEGLMAKASKLGLESKNLRYWLWSKILDQAKFDNKYRGKGKAFDDSVINWSDSGKGHLIRAIGGKKLLKDEDGHFRTFTYKNTFVDDKIPDRKDNMASADEVKFPTEILIWWIDPKEFNSFLEKFISKKEQELNETYHLDVKLKGKYSELPCIKKIMEGVEVGSRNEATFPLTLALFLDGYSEQSMKETLQKFKNNCPQKPEPFTEEEAYSWIKWVQKTKPVWNCKRCEAYCDRKICEFNNVKYYPIWEFLKQEKLLDKIVEVVRDVGEHKKQASVVGETNNLKLIFLIFMSAYSDDPQNLNEEEESRVGKTALIKPFLDLFPKENLIVAGGMSKKSVYYDYAISEDDGTPVVDLNNKIIILLEESGSEPFLKTIKPILSHDRKEMEYKFVEKLGHGQNITKTVKIVGWPVYIGLSAYSGKESEHLGRVITINPTNKSDKFHKVIKNKALKNPFYKNEHHKDWLILKETIKVGWLSLEVFNPFRDLIADIFPHDDPRSQDDYERFVSMIERFAFVNQRQRKIIRCNKVDAVLVSKDDIIETFNFMENALESTILGISNKVKNFFEEILVPNKPDSEEEDSVQLTYARILNLFNDKHKRTMREQTLKTNYLRPLRDLGYIEISKFGKSNIVKLREAHFSGKIAKFKEKLSQLQLTEEYLSNWFSEMNLHINKMQWGEIKNSEIANLSSVNFKDLLDYLTKSKSPQ